MSNDRVNARKASISTSGKDYWDEEWRRALAAGAASPDASTFPNDIDRVKMEFLRRYLPGNGTVAEVGCGSARLLARVGSEQRRFRLIAIDESSVALQCAAQNAEAFRVSIEPRVGGVQDLPLDSGSIDVVLSGGLLEHFRDPQPVLAEMLRVLRSGGLFYADVVPRKTSWFRSAETPRLKTSEWLAPEVYESSFGAHDYENWLTQLGCKHLETRYCGVYPGSIARWGPRKRRLIGGALKWLDGTVLAERFGWYFMLAARKVT